MRNQLTHLQPREDSHAGLLLQRYVSHSADGSEQWSQAKRSILDAARKVEIGVLYRIAFDHWSASLPNDPAPIDLATQGRLVVGLGSENVLETGIRLHHTYGMPIIPGSALKGLAAHYCDQVWRSSDKRFKKPTTAEDEDFRKYLAEKGPKPEDSFHRLWFGNTDDSGCITFHDAWLTPESPEPLKLDVMTPHHPKWNDLNSSAAPTDFDSPIPVPFLSVAGTFRVAVSWHGPVHKEAKCWTERAMEMLCDALCDWGVGGKTNSGYGLFDRKKLDEARKEQEIKQTKLRLEAEEQAKLAAMSPIERSILDFVTTHPNKLSPEYMKLLEELKKESGRWTSDEDRREIAKRVKQGMIEAKKWGKKDKDAERTAFIKKTLGES